MLTRGLATRRVCNTTPTMLFLDGVVVGLVQKTASFLDPLSPLPLLSSPRPLAPSKAKTPHHTRPRAQKRVHTGTHTSSRRTERKQERDVAEKHNMH